MKLNINLKFNKVTPDFFLNNHIAIKSILKNLRHCEKNKTKKTDLNLKNTARIFNSVPCVFDIYSANNAQSVIKTRSSRFIPYKNGNCLKWTASLDKKSIKYNFIFSHRFFRFQQKLWLSTYGLSYLFYDTFIKNKALRGLNFRVASGRCEEKSERQTEGKLKPHLTYNSARKVISANSNTFVASNEEERREIKTDEIKKNSNSNRNFRISQVIWSWIKMLMAQIQSEIFKCATYGCNKNVFKLQTFLSKSWSMQLLIFCFILDPSGALSQTKSVDVSALLKKKIDVSPKTRKQKQEFLTKKTNELSEIMFNGIHSKNMVCHQNNLYEFDKMITKKNNSIWHVFSSMLTNEQNFKFKQLLKKYFLCIILQPQWETKNSGFCYDIRPGVTVYDCISFIFQLLKTERKFIFHTEISFLSNMFDSFRFTMPHTDATQSTTNVINNIIINSTLITQDMSNIELNNTTQQTSLTKKLYAPKFLNSVKFDQPRLKQKESNFYLKIYLNDLENQMVDFGLKTISIENVLTDLSFYARLREHSNCITPHDIYAFCINSENNHLKYRPYCIDGFDEIASMYYPSGIYKKKAYSILLYRVVSLKIYFKESNNHAQQKMFRKKSAFYNECAFFSEAMVQKQNRVRYDELKRHNASQCKKLAYSFDYSLIQYNSQILLICSNKRMMDRCIEFSDQWFRKQNLKLNFCASDSQQDVSHKKQNFGLNFSGFYIPSVVHTNQFQEIYAPEMNPKMPFSIICANTKNFMPKNSFAVQTGIMQKKSKQSVSFKKNSTPVVLFPSKSNVRNYLQQIKYIIKNSKAHAQDLLITKLARKINLWCYHYRIISNKKIFYYCDYMIFKWLWRWCCRRHPNKKKNWIKLKYFHYINKRNWNFGVYQNSTKSFYYLPKNSQIKLVRHLKIPEHYSIYDKNWKNWLQRLS